MALSFIKHKKRLETGKQTGKEKMEKIHFLRCPSNYCNGNWSRSLGVQNAFQEEKANP
jgi:hypothetical protein